MKNISFGHTLLIDTGASKPNNGSLKISILSDKTGQEISKSEKIVCPKGFEKDCDYLDGIKKGISENYLEANEKLEQLDTEDKALSGMVIYAPGATINNYSAILPNLRLKTTQTPIKNVDYKQLIPALKDEMTSQGIKIHNNFKLMVTNDMIGAGTSIAKSLSKTSEFQEGYCATFLMAGGGLGVGQIEHLGDRVIVKSFEDGHINVFGTDKTLEKYGASAVALIKNFSESLGLNEQDTEKLVKMGNAKIVTQPEIIPNSPQESQALTNSGLFEPLEKEDGTEFFKLKNINSQQHERAKKSAIIHFIDALAILSAEKVTEGTNEVIITGPLAKGIKSTIQNNSDLFEDKTLSELVGEKVDSFLDLSGKNMSNLYNFNINTDIEVANNTASGKTVLEGAFVGKEKRGNWLSIPTTALKKT